MTGYIWVPMNRFEQNLGGRHRKNFFRKFLGFGAPLPYNWTQANGVLVTEEQFLGTRNTSEYIIRVKLKPSLLKYLSSGVGIVLLALNLSSRPAEAHNGHVYFNSQRFNPVALGAVNLGYPWLLPNNLFPGKIPYTEVDFPTLTVEAFRTAQAASLVRSLEDKVLPYLIEKQRSTDVRKAFGKALASIGLLWVVLALDKRFPSRKT